MVLSFLVDKQIITRVDKEKVVRDSMNYLYANFEFSPDWTGQKTAVFKSKSGAFNVLLDDDGKCLVPWEVLQDEVIEISVFCGALITANVVKIITLASGYTIGEEGREPTPDVYTQIMEKLSEIEAEVDPESLQALIDAYLADKDYVTEADVETIVAAYVDEHKSEWQGSEVSVTQTLQSGTKIAEISVDGTTTNLYAPAGGGGATALDDLTDVSLTTPAAGDVLVYDGQKWGNKEIEGINKEASYVEVTETLSHAYIWNNNGDIVDSPSSNMLTINVVAGEEYRITGTYRYKSALYGFYADSQATSGTTYPNDGQNRSQAVTEEVNIIIPAGVTVLRASSYGASIKVEKLAGIGKLFVDFGGNILYKKKWCACGDSFTEGDFSDYTDSEGHTGKASDAYDPVKQMWKAYPWLISNRNNMELQLLARGGNDFTNIEGAERPFSNSNTSQYNYTQIATDCDYITLSFGLNEVNLTTEQIGTSADTTNETLWGAYYVVLNSILTANPTVKIGIIISDAWMCDNTTYYNALKEIAEYWGIPYLDLSGGNKEVPMMINRRGTVSNIAKTLRGTAMAMAYGTNNHPNPAGHKYRSTVIENFLRSL